VSDLWETVGMATKPELKRISADVYECTVCHNFRVQITKLLNAGELRRELDKQLAEHVRKDHSEDFSQAAARIVREATEDR